MKDREKIRVSLSDRASTLHIGADIIVSDSTRAYLENEPISSQIHEEMGELQKLQRKFQKVSEITKITNTGVLKKSSSKPISLYQIFSVC